MKIIKVRKDHLGIQWVRLQMYDFEQDKMLFDFNIQERDLPTLGNHISSHIQEYFKNEMK